MDKPPNSAVKILLADDSVIMHRAVSLALKKEPFEVITCDNGQDALRLSLQHQPAIVLADLDMPGMTGVELCKAIRVQATLKDTKVVLLCGSFDQIDEARVESVQADGRLWKPFESHVLTALLHALLKAPARGTAEATLGSPAPRNSAEATAPLSGSQVRRPPPPRRGGDVVADMTQETFHHASDRERVAAEATADSLRAPPAPEWNSEPTIAPAPVNPEPTQAPLSEEVASENLWTSDFAPSMPEAPKVEPEATVHVTTDFSEVRAIESAKRPTEQQEAQQNVAPTVELSMNPPAAPASKRIEVEMDEWLADKDVSRVRSSIRQEVASSVSQTIGGLRTMAEPTAAPKGTGAVAEGQLRQIVRDEVEQAMRGWLRAQLEEKLSAVMAAIEREQ